MTQRLNMTARTSTLTTISGSGVQVYDARLAAFMRVYGVPNILTLNAKDFSRYGVTAVHPANV